MKLTSENTEKSPFTQTPETTAALMAIIEFEPLIVQEFPDLMESFSQAKVHLNSIAAVADLEAAKKRDENGKRNERSFDEKSDEIKKLDEEGKLTDYQIYNLVQSAKTEEDYKQAENWLDKMKEEIAREGTTNFLFFKRAKLAVKEKRYDDARKYALKVVKIEHRAVLFFDIAESRLKEPMTKAESLDTLLETYQSALKAPDTIEKAQVLLGLAFMFGKIDPLNALGSLTDAIKTANKMENPNLVTSNVTLQTKGNNFVAFMSYTVPGFDVSETFYELSQKDFQGALTHSTNFSDKYLRTLAVLATVKDCEKNEKPNKQKPKTK